MRIGCANTNSKVQISSKWVQIVLGSPWSPSRRNKSCPSLQYLAAMACARFRSRICYAIFPLLVAVMGNIPRDIQENESSETYCEGCQWMKKLGSLSCFRDHQGVHTNRELQRELSRKVAWAFRSSLAQMCGMACGPCSLPPWQKLLHGTLT